MQEGTIPQIEDGKSPEMPKNVIHTAWGKVRIFQTHEASAASKTQCYTVLTRLNAAAFIFQIG